MARRGVGVLGLGKTGEAMLDHLLAGAESGPLVLFTDAPVPDPEQQRKYEARGVAFWSGPAAFDHLATLERIILSPGFDGRQPRFETLRRAGVEILSEVEFAFRKISAPIVAVTGTNGKSTTVSLIHHLLRFGGRSSVLAGNIGVPFVSQVQGMDPGAVVVLELSSFQLEEIDRFRPHVGLLLNVTPDHLDRYPSLEAYADAKLRLFQNQKPEDFAIINADDPILRQYRGRFGRGRVYAFSRLRPLVEGAFLGGGEVVLRVPGGEVRISLAQNPLRGAHNLENILASFLAARLVGVDPEQLAAGLATFRGLAHRMEWVGTVGGVDFINDSKATNVDAALKSIEGAGDPLVLILGGKDKGGDFSLLRDPISRQVERVLLIGMAAERIASQLPGLEEKMARVADLDEAVESGFRVLEGRGRGVVLLAPACASFDQFRNFEHRGEAFAQAVNRLKERIHHG